MKRTLILAIAVLYSVATSSFAAKPAKIPAQISRTVVGFEPSIGAYGGVRIELDITGEDPQDDYVNMDLHMYRKFGYGFPRQYYYAWVWAACQITVHPGDHVVYYDVPYVDGTETSDNATQSDYVLHPW